MCLCGKCQFTDSIKCIQLVKENGVVYGIKSGIKIHKGGGCDRPFSHIEIILNTGGHSQRNDVFCKLMKTSHKVSWVRRRHLLPFQESLK